MKYISNIFLAFLITGCSLQQISPDERDRSGKYDGKWLARIHVTESIKLLGHTQFSCRQDKFDLRIDISDGIMSTHKAKEGLGYIKNDGTFYFNKQHGKWNIHADRSYRTNKMHLILSGKLSGIIGYGDITLAVGTGNYGCDGRVGLAREI